jgi:AraC-like DNA-binding protein
MDLSFATPCDALSRYVLSYYMFSDDYSIIEDTQRADVGAITFILNGSGHYDFKSGERVQTTPIFLNGPGNHFLTFSAFGPLRFVGISLQPGFWTHAIESDAKQLANTACDVEPMLSVGPRPTLETLREMQTIDEMAPVLDAYLLRLAKPIPPEQQSAIETIRRWLASTMFPNVADIYAAFDLSERQVTRIVNRYFGAPPQTLARKYGALRAASAIFINNGMISDEIRSHYADMSHLIREVKAFTGQTPRQLKTRSNPLMRATLLPDHFRELKPVS